MAKDRFFYVIPLKTFFKAFLPVNQHPPYTAKAADFTRVRGGPNISVEDMYEPLVTELNKHCSPCRFHVSPLDAIRDRVDGADVRPVIWMKDHSLSIPGGRTFRTSTAAVCVSAAHRTSTLVTAFDWGLCELSCEVKNVTRDSLFDVDDDESIDERERQVIAYFKQQAAMQHRTFIFQLFIFGHNAQFVRWDRCQAVVSEAFDYHENPHLLAEFVWRYSRLDRTTGRGWDKNVSLADPDAANLFERKINEVLQTPPTDMSSGTAKTIYRALRTTFMAEDTLAGDYPTYAVRISGSSPDKRAIETTLLIRRPFSQHPNPFGRATRAFLAYDITCAEFRFLKDVWRLQEPLPGCLSEEEFYTATKTSNNPEMRLPKVYFAGDVEGADGEVQRAPVGYRLRSQQGRVHCCVLQELLCPLNSFASSRELVEVMFDVMKTMNIVHNDHGILQSDVSVTNVMFRINDAGNTEGVLNDWDNNRPVRTEGSTPLEVVGTWEFMAIERYNDRHAQNSLRYDLEAAILWVFLSVALRHLEYTPKYSWHLDMFGQHTSLGNDFKSKFLRNPLEYPVFTASPELTSLVDAICREYAGYYIALEVWETARSRETRDEVERAKARVSDVGMFVVMFEDALASDLWPVDDPMTEFGQPMDLDPGVDRRSMSMMSPLTPLSSSMEI